MTPSSKTFLLYFSMRGCLGKFPPIWFTLSNQESLSYVASMAYDILNYSGKTWQKSSLTPLGLAHLGCLMSPTTHQQTMPSPTSYEGRTDCLRRKKQKKRPWTVTIKRQVMYHECWLRWSNKAMSPATQFSSVKFNLLTQHQFINKSFQATLQRKFQFNLQFNWNSWNTVQLIIIQFNKVNNVFHVRK